MIGLECERVAGFVRRSCMSQRTGCQHHKAPNPCREAARSFPVPILTVLHKTAKETRLL